MISWSRRDTLAHVGEGKDQPFKTISHAAQMLQPGERVEIAAGVYREFVQPTRGGTGPACACCS